MSLTVSHAEGLHHTKRNENNIPVSSFSASTVANLLTLFMMCLCKSRESRF